MIKNKLFSFIILGLSVLNLYSQYDTINKNTFIREGPIINLLDSINIHEIFSDNRNPNLLTVAREKTIKELGCNKNIIELYLEDTSYYIQKTIPQLYEELDKKEGYFRYFSSIYGMEYILKENLPDGYYCLYSISKNEADRKVKDRFLVTAGGFKNGKKDGIFVFKEEPEYNKGSNIYKTIEYTNDTVNGKIIETWDGVVRFAAEYFMNKKNGFYIDNFNISNLKILLYRDDNILIETNF